MLSKMNKGRFKLGKQEINFEGDELNMDDLENQEMLDELI